MKRWTDHDHRVLLDMWRDGADRAQIGRVLGRAPEHVSAQISWLRAKGTRSVPFRGKGNRIHRRREAEVAPGTGYVASSLVQPAIIYDRYGVPTGQVLDPLTRQRRPA